MKRIMYMILASSLAISFGLCGCQSNEVNQETSKQTQEEQTSPDEETQSVIDEINSIGDVTLEKKELIDSTRQAYGSLNSEQKNLVDNYDVLKAAISSLDELERAEEEKAKAFAVGETVEDEDFRVTLTSAQLDSILESPNSRTSWEPDSNATFVILEFDIEALNSNQIAVDSGAVSNVVATYNGNTYKGWDYKYVVSELWLSAKRTYFEANMPVHVYVYTSIPSSATSGSVTVDMDIAGQDKQIVI